MAKMTKAEKEIIGKLEPIIDGYFDKLQSGNLITWQTIASNLNIDIATLKTLASNFGELAIIQKMESVLRYSFFYYSLSSKINSGIELFIKQELPTNTSQNNLKVSKDLMDLQKKVAAFSINSADDLGVPNIDNDYDDVIVIKDPDVDAWDEYKEMTEELDE